MADPRDRATRIADTLTMLTTPAIDAWVASASAAGEAHLVPLSLAWHEDRVVLALDGSSVTARNVAASGSARLAVGQTRDVVMIDAALDRTVEVGADVALGAAYVGQSDWDPRQAPGYVFLVLAPQRVQAWREVNEIKGRTLMRGGSWLTGGARAGEAERETR